MRTKTGTIQPGPANLRHVIDGAPGTARGINVLNRTFVPQNRRGINGRQGYTQGQVETRRDEEGNLTVTFPNTAGSQGGLHRDRFLILQRGRRRPAPDGSGATIYEGGNYRAGDEWLELYQGRHDLESVVTPTAAKVDRNTVELTCTDPLWLLNKARETAAGHWCHAPRDVLEHYSQIWEAVVADDFSNQLFTFSANNQTTADGRWTYHHASEVEGQSVCRLVSDGLVDAGANLIGTLAYSIPIKPTSSEPHTAWRAEVEYDRGAIPTNGELLFGMQRSTVSGLLAAFLSVGLTSTYASNGDQAVDLALATSPGSTRLAIEGRGRWIFFYVNGELKTVMPFVGTAEPTGYVPRVKVYGGDGTLDVKVRSVLVRRTRPLLMRGTDKGDYRLPGKPTPGGLTGSYFSDADLAAKHGANAFLYTLNPTRQPAIRRLDTQIELNTANNLPVGLPAKNISVRWTGAIYLRLAEFDYRLRATADDRVRVWVGKTRVGEQVIDDWTAAGHTATATYTPYLRSHLGQVTGWYPIVVEYSQGTGPGSLIFEAERSDESGQWVPPGGSINIIDPSGVDRILDGPPLSPTGIFEAQVRYESHYDQFRQIVRDFGYQFRTEPRQLESGLFPAEVVPRLRVGRDTEFVLDDIEAREVQAEISAEDAADTILADGQGIAAEGAQLTAELIDFTEVAKHVMVHTEYEQIADVSIADLFFQRLDSMLTLRGGTWERITAQPQGFRRLLDRFPLTGLPAEIQHFKWQPGDGARLHQELVGVRDTSPRPMMGITRGFVPDGFGVPSVAWRQRQRSGREVLREMYRQPLKQARNYQRQLVTVNGNPGGVAGGDVYSRVNLPAALDDVIRAELVVQSKSDASPKTIEINGTPRATFTAPGRYDITGWVASQDGPRMYTRATGGTGSAEYALELLVAV